MISTDRCYNHRILLFLTLVGLTQLSQAKTNTFVSYLSTASALCRRQHNRTLRIPELLALRPYEDRLDRLAQSVKVTISILGP